MPKKKPSHICAVIEIGSDMVTMLISPNKNGAVDILDRLECFFDLEKEIARLVQKRYLTEEEADSLNRKKIIAFYRSSL